MKLRRAVIAAFGLVLLLGLWYAAHLTKQSITKFGIGAVAPDFHAKTLTTPPEPKGIAAYRGQVTLINIWATYCEPCLVEMPSLDRLYARYKSKGFKVVGVAVDDPGFEETIKEFVAKLGVTFEILHEGSGDIERAYRARGIPATYVVGRDGRVRMIRQGAADWDAPEHYALIERLLDERP